MTRAEAYAWYVNLLLDRIREDTYPSATQMALVEDALGDAPHLKGEYLDALMEKVADDRWPSTPMLARIRRVADQLPA